MDERKLFLFSALTANAHRIHYDLAYARDIEGHRGLLVHGPLTALLAAEALRMEDGRDVQTFNYHLVAPCYAHDSLTFKVAADGARGAKVVGTSGDRTCLTASATFGANVTMPTLG